jgi:hypothetical protein
MDMHNLQRVLNARVQRGLLAAVVVVAAGCSKKTDRLVGPRASSEAVTLDGLAKQCKLECPAKGIAEGNASISGVASADAFFQSVLDYQATANNVSSSIEAQLVAIRGDFGLAADADIGAALMAQIGANTEGGLSVDSEPARCSVDTEATIRAQAHCDSSVKPGKVSCKCRGACEVDASANVDCGTEAQLVCTTNAAMVTCDGKCQGSCITALDAAAACSGKCRGSCSGKCSAYARNERGDLECAGECDGQCTGRCEARLAAEAECKGMCDGECSVTPGTTACNGGIRARCESMSDVMMDCRGRCQGQLEPPKAKAECEVTARAEAKLNVQCTPPRLAVKYKLKAGLDAAASAQFVAAADNLEVRLPALFAAIEHANSVTEAQAELIGDGQTAVRSSISEALSAKGMVQAKIVGLTCAVEQLDAVGTAIDGSSKRLSVSLDASTKLRAVLMGSNS